jgi:crossover junction endonuclease MUS81
MKACPLVFQHPSEAQQLNGLGPKLCDRLTEKLKAYCEENGLPMPEGPSKGATLCNPLLWQDLLTCEHDRPETTIR